LKVAWRTEAQYAYFPAAARQLVQQLSQRANQLANEQRTIDAEKTGA
jgi:hypothetical protein